MEQRLGAVKKQVVRLSLTRTIVSLHKDTIHVSKGRYICVSVFRMRHMMTPLWTSVQMHLMASQWKVTCTREPAMLSKHGAGTALFQYLQSNFVFLITGFISYY